MCNTSVPSTLYYFQFVEFVPIKRSFSISFYGKHFIWGVDTIKRLSPITGVPIKPLYLLNDLILKIICPFSCLKILPRLWFDIFVISKFFILMRAQGTLSLSTIVALKGSVLTYLVRLQIGSA